MSGDCSLINNDLYVKPVETCTFAALYKFNDTKDETKIDKSTIYKNTFKSTYIDINSNFRDPLTNKYIYKYSSNGNKDLCFPLKENDKNSPYAVNCVILTGNPLYTYDKNKKTCTVIPELLFNPPYFKYNENKDYIYYDNSSDPDGIYSYNKKDKSGYCENKWYDWITIPNYHFGNNYLKDSGSFSKEDVKVCYAPCEKGKMPYYDINGEYKCVSKKIAENGLYEKKMDYSPISLINLIGNSQENLTNLYILMTLYEYDKIDKVNYELITDRTILNPNCEINILTGDMPRCIHSDNKNEKSVYNNFNEPRQAHKELSDVIMKNIINVDTFDIIKKYENYPNLITYKNPYFEEKDTQTQQLTLLGLDNDNNKILTDPILIHTFKIAYGIYNFMEYEIFSQGLIRLDQNDPNSDFIGYYTEYNPNTILTELLDKNDDYKNKNDNTKLNIKKRLANILYKAINVCYNNQTEFSKNILSKTKIAFDRYLTKTNLVQEYAKLNFFNSTKKNIDMSTYSAENASYTMEINKVNKEYLPIIDTGFSISQDLSIDNIKANIKEAFRKQGITIPTDISEKSEHTVESVDLNKYVIRETIILPYPLYFRIEPIEEKVCNIDEIYNPETKNCEACSIYCDPNKNKCENPRCKLYCKGQCTDRPITGDNTIIGKTACGNIKSQKTKEEVENSNKIKNKYSETPLGENSFDFFSLFNNSVKSAMSIVFFLIILYIIYIIYEVFGESLLLLLNFISYWLFFIYNTIIATIKAIISGNPGAIPRYVAFDLAQYEKDTNINRYERVSTKLFTKPS
jgi:hypothetical protein